MKEKLKYGFGFLTVLYIVPLLSESDRIIHHDYSSLYAKIELLLISAVAVLYGLVASSVIDILIRKIRNI